MPEPIPMINFSSDEKLALLLNLLGDDVAAAAMQGLPASRVTELKRRINEFGNDPPTTDEIEYVINDFFKFFQFAIQTLGINNLGDKKSDIQIGDGEKRVSPRNQITYFPQFELTDDPVADLDRMDSYQVYKALEEDHPKTIAMILQKLEIKQAAAVMEQLTAEKRAQVVIYMTQDSTVPQPIVNQVLQTTASRAQMVKYREIETETSQSIAELLRSLPKNLRVELMEQLMSNNPELGEQVKMRLYLFEDVLRLDDRNVQKLLSQIQTDSLIVALQRCDETLTNKLLSNLSKRARESIIEEMEYKRGVADEEIEISRSEIVAVLAQLDESGEIKMD